MGWRNKKRFQKNIWKRYFENYRIIVKWNKSTSTIYALLVDLRKIVYKRLSRDKKRIYEAVLTLHNKEK